MMSKEKILKGIRQQIENYGYNITDYEISKEASPEAITEIKAKMERLKVMAEELDKLLM